MSFLPYAAAAWLLLLAIYAMATSRNLVHLVVCLSVAQSSTYVVLLAIGYRARGTAPVFSDIPKGTRVTDPIVQALTLTDIVVSVTISALLLALAVQAYKRRGSLDPDELRPLQG